MEGVESIDVEEGKIAVVFDGKKITKEDLSRITRESIELGYKPENREVKIKKSFKIVALLLSAIAVSGCATSAKKAISMRSQSERTDVFKEVTPENAPQAGFSDLNVQASIKKTLDKQTEEVFLLNIDGQAVSWSVTGKREDAPQYDEKGQPNPDRGEGMKYMLARKLRLRPGPHKIFLALPAENVFKEVSTTLKDGETAALEFKPVYATGRHPMRHFTKGIVFYEVY